MKKFICLILSLLVICSSVSFQCFANEKAEVKNIQGCEASCSVGSILKDINLNFKLCKDINNLSEKQKKNNPLITSEVFIECKLMEEFAKTFNLPVYKKYIKEKRKKKLINILKATPVVLICSYGIFFEIIKHIEIEKEFALI